MPLKVNFFISHKHSQCACQKTLCLKWRADRSYTDRCNYLGNTICSHDEHVIVDNSITGMNMRLNNLLAEISHCDSGTLSTLFRTYCMNIY